MRYRSAVAVAALATVAAAAYGVVQQWRGGAASMPLGFGECEANAAPESPRQEVSGFPFRCGVSEIPSGRSDIQVFAYTQKGLWCWSNAGFIYDRVNDEVTVIDVLVDAKQTQLLVDEIRRVAPSSAKFKNLIYTHCDIDHWGGQQVAYDLFETVYAAGSGCERAMREWSQGHEAALRSIAIGHYLWETIGSSLVETLASTSLTSRVLQFSPRIAESLVAVLAKLNAAELFAPFEFDKMSFEKERYPTYLVQGRETIQVGNADVHLIPMGVPSHSDHDLVVHIPEAKTVFAGDILFNSVTPVVWAGTFEDCQAALAALDDIPDVSLYVPGHGAIADRSLIEDLRGYWKYLESETQTCFELGLPEEACAVLVDSGLPPKYRQWGDPERLVINIMMEYRKRKLPSSSSSVNKFEFIAKQMKHVLLSKIEGRTKAIPVTTS